MSIPSEVIQLIHQGKGYSVSGVLTIAGGASYTFVGVPDALNVHFHDMRVDASNGPVGIDFIESPTVSNYGTKSAAMNRRRDSINPARMGVYMGATISGGVTLFNTRIHGVTTGQGRGGEGVVSGEWDLDPGKIYAVRITNLTSPSESIAVSVDMQFYEDEL